MIKADAMFCNNRENDEGEVWFRFEVPHASHEDMMAALKFTKKDAFHIVLLVDGMHVHRGFGQWNGMVQSPDGDIRFTLRSDHNKLDVSGRGIMQKSLVVFLLDEAEWQEFKAALSQSGYSFDERDTSDATGEIETIEIS